MKKKKCYENYPVSTVIIAALLELSIYSIGALIISRLGIIWMAIYLAFVVIFLIRLLGKSCVNCYYYGKLCFSGKGKLSSLFFKKGSSRAFINRKVTVKDLLPDMLLSFSPIIIGIIVLIIKFDWVVLLMMAALLLLSFPGNGFVRGKLACIHCKQCLIGCPAQKLFNKKR
jgi:hypothetical protein